MLLNAHCPLEMSRPLETWSTRRVTARQEHGCRKADKDRNSPNDKAIHTLPPKAAAMAPGQARGCVAGIASYKPKIILIRDHQGFCFGVNPLLKTALLMATVAVPSFPSQ